MKSVENIKKSSARSKSGGFAKSFSKIPVGFRVAFLSIVPLLGFLIVSGLNIVENVNRAGNAESVLRLSETIPPVTGFVHMLQRERGASAGFISSGGQKFVSELPALRADTDAALQAYEQALNPQTVQDIGFGMDERIGELAGEVAKLEEFRSGVDGLSLSVPQMASYYTSTISDLLHIVTHASHIAQDPRVAESLFALEMLLLGKEYAGIERAVGTGGFNVAEFNQGAFLRFNSLIAQQDVLFKEFHEIADKDLVAFFDATMSGPVVERVEELRSSVRASAFGEPLANISGGEWFAASTARIDLLKQVEDLSNQYLITQAQTLQANAASDLRFGLWLNAVSLVAIVLLTFFVTRSITRPLSGLTAAMNKLTVRDYDVEIFEKDHADSFGEMARAVAIFRENALKVDSMTEEGAAASEQRRIDRANMMEELRKEFGAVVEAAVAGDFSQRVEAKFPDEELNNLARGVNSLVENVERGLAETGVVLAALAKMDLTQRVNGSFEGEFDKLKTNTNDVANNLTDIVGQLRDTSSSLKTATGEILEGANDLSSRTTKQAATIEETSAAMEQLAATVLQNTKRAQEATENSKTVTRTAEQGGEVMIQANSAMERITESSSKISNIIGMIDDIAFQTNLLALNASVEAARAGEAGKGFAVVAVEVRRLAQSAAEASSEVKELIEQSATEVTGGSKLVAEAAEKLQTMLEFARSSDQLIHNISQDSQSQGTAIGEVNVAVKHMDEMTQHNAALVEETNAAIEQTESQASELDRIVENFQIDGSSVNSGRGRASTQQSKVA